MDEMEKFRHNASDRDLCVEFAEQWATFRTKPQLVAFCLSSKAIPYMATATLEGWGLSIPYLYSEFKECINGNMKLNDLYYNENNFTVGLYVQYDDTLMDLTNDTSHFMECKNSTITIGTNKCLNIHISNRSDLRLSFMGYNHVYIYVYDESKVDLGVIGENVKVNVRTYDDRCKINYECQGGTCNIKNKKLSIW